MGTSQQRCSTWYHSMVLHRWTFDCSSTTACHGCCMVPLAFSSATANGILLAPAALFALTHAVNTDNPHTEPATSSLLVGLDHPVYSTSQHQRLTPSAVGSAETTSCLQAGLCISSNTSIQHRTLHDRPLPPPVGNYSGNTIR